MEVRKYIDSAVRATTATLLGTGAIGQSKDAGYLKDVLTDVPLYSDAPIVGSALESVGNFAAQHQNPTVAFLGLSAIAIAVNRGPLVKFNWTKNRNNFANIMQKNVRSANNNYGASSTPTQPLTPEMLDTMRDAKVDDVEMRASNVIGAHTRPSGLEHRGEEHDTFVGFTGVDMGQRGNKL